MLTRPWLLVVLVAVASFLGGLGVGLALDDGGGSEQSAVPYSDERALVASVIDGDTVVLENGEVIRYLGIDTPEVGSQDCFAAEATDRNRELVEGKAVILVPDVEEEDRYGRLLRWVFLDDGTFVNAELVWEGYAKTFFFQENRYRQVFVQLQLAASQSGSGAWSACDWR